jgi:hypothetical protein
VVSVSEILQRLDGELPGAVTALAEEAGSRLAVTDERSAGTEQGFTFTATLTAAQREAADELARRSAASPLRPRPRRS